MSFQIQNTFGYLWKINKDTFNEAFEISGPQLKVQSTNSLKFQKEHKRNPYQVFRRNMINLYDELNYLFIIQYITYILFVLHFLIYNRNLRYALYSIFWRFCRQNEFTHTLKFCHHLFTPVPFQIHKTFTHLCNINKDIF